MVSKLKVENVENPPQNPMIIKYLIKLFPSIFSFKKKRVKPKSNVASIFAVKVPAGNFEK